VSIEGSERVVREQPHAPTSSVVEPLTDLDGELVTRGVHRAQHLADVEPARRPHEGVPTAALQRTHEEHLDVSAGLSPHPEPSRDDAGVVDDEKVARLEHPGKVRDETMIGSARAAAVDEQTRRVARLGRDLRDARCRKVVLERLHRRTRPTVGSHRDGIVVPHTSLLDRP
jgi:hypothetical protein